MLNTSSKHLTMNLSKKTHNNEVILLKFRIHVQFLSQYQYIFTSKRIILKIFLFFNGVK
jgi:hypothetical protein